MHTHTHTHACVSGAVAQLTAHGIGAMLSSSASASSSTGAGGLEEDARLVTVFPLETQHRFAKDAHRVAKNATKLAREAETRATEVYESATEAVLEHRRKTKKTIHKSLCYYRNLCKRLRFAKRICKWAETEEGRESWRRDVMLQAMSTHFTVCCTTCKDEASLVFKCSICDQQVAYENEE